MKKLLFTTLVLGFATSSLVFAENRISGGVGASIGFGKSKVGENYVNPILPFIFPNLDAEIGFKLNEIFSLKLQGTLGLDVVAQGGTNTHAAVTPMVTAKISDDLKLSAGMKFKDSVYAVRKTGDDHVIASPHSSKAIYAEVRSAFDKKNEAYVGLSKNIDDQGFDVKVGVMHVIGNAQ